MTEPGRYEYTVSIAVDREEKNYDDNQQTVRVVAGDQSLQVLLLAGSPTREYRWLTDALLRDEGIQAAVWLASADHDGGGGTHRLRP